MTMQEAVTAPELSPDHEVRQRIRDAAIQQFGQHGFGTELWVVAEAAGVSAALPLQKFGSSQNLRSACDDYILETIRTAKSESLQSMSPTTWFTQLAQIESYAPIMHYLVRSMLSGGQMGRALMDRMIGNAEGYLEDAVRAGNIKPSRDPKARAAFLAMSGGGAFLLYLHMHDNPSDMAAVLRDYSKDMVLPALEVYAHGLMTDTTTYDAFVSRQEGAESQPSESGN